MWTEITRRKYEREEQRYASDLTDAEWALIAPRMPAVKRLGRPRETELRAVLDAILYIARTGCQWRMLPKDFPPFTTVQGYFYDWRDDGLFERINFELLLQAREAAGREPSPSAGVIDSQSVKTTESGGPRGYDAAKKVKGRKRHIVTDTGGLLVGAEVHPADVQDRDGAKLVIEAIHQLFPWLHHLFADSVYNGPQRFFNTAGVGVCFQSQRAWERIFAEPGFDVVAFQRGLLWWWLGRSLRWMMPRLFVKAIFTRSLFSEAEAGLRGGRRSALRYAGLRARPSDTCKWQRSGISALRLHQKMLAQGRNVTRRAK